TLQNYSVLLFWGAFNDLISIAADIMSMERLTAKLPSFVFIASGPCTYISRDFCNYCNSFFCGTIVQSTIIQCISFWYRFRILRKPQPSALTLNVIVLLWAIPNVAHIIFFKHIKDYDSAALLSTLQLLYPRTNWTGVYFYGLADLFQPRQAVIFGYFIVIVPILLCFLIVTRNRVVNMIKRQSLSDKTKNMHRIFLKILTIHALLPISMVISVVAASFIIAGFYNPELSALHYMLGMFPPCADPFVTIWFMKPYRRNNADVVLFSLSAFGVVIGLLLIVAIVFATPPTNKNYSILILWGALNDLVAILADAFSQERSVVKLPALVFVASGPCTQISIDLCNLCNTIFCGSIVQSLNVQCISFWYRFRILRKQPLGAVHLNAVVIVCVLPNIAHMVGNLFEKHVKTYDSSLMVSMQALYPQTNWTGASLYGLDNVFDPLQATTFLYFFIITPVLVVYLVITRLKVLNSLKDRQSMSEKTFQMHHMFIKVFDLFCFTVSFLL
ncbi:hypothetical protein PFISCL1PPCAC_3328, partial [Pristionchus fissidentatus]